MKNQRAENISRWIFWSYYGKFSWIERRETIRKKNTGRATMLTRIGTTKTDGFSLRKWPVTFSRTIPI
jgi:hypothetical protein